MDINPYVDIIQDGKGCILFDGRKYNEKEEEDGGGTVRKDIVSIDENTMKGRKKTVAELSEEISAMKY